MLHFTTAQMSHFTTAATTAHALVRQRESGGKHVERIPYLAGDVAQTVQVPLQVVLAADFARVWEVIDALQGEQQDVRGLGF